MTPTRPRRQEMKLSQMSPMQADEVAASLRSVQAEEGNGRVYSWEVVEPDYYLGDKWYGSVVYGCSYDVEVRG